MKGLVLKVEARTALTQEVAIPTAAPGEALIKVHAIALNPVDALYTFNLLGDSGRAVGSDFAGTVVSIADSDDSNIKSGTRVAGFLKGASSVDERPGAFAEYLVCPVDVLWRIPDDISFEEAATVSLCVLTAAQALFSRLGLEAPFDWKSGEAHKDGAECLIQGLTKDPLVVLIYGASTSMGLFAAQLLHYSAVRTETSLNLIGVASQKRKPILRASPYLYDALIDYRDQDWPRQVSELTNGSGVSYAFDCISEGSTVKNVASTLADGGKLAIVRSREGGAWDTEGLPQGVDPKYGAVWEGLGVEFKYQNLVVPASKDSRAFGVAL